LAVPVTAANRIQFRTGAWAAFAAQAFSVFNQDVDPGFEQEF
jgi:hypothetical protein